MKKEDLLIFVICHGARTSSSSYFGKQSVQGYMAVFDSQELVDIALTCKKVCGSVLKACRLAFIKRGITFNLLPLIELSGQTETYGRYLDLQALKFLQISKKSMMILHGMKVDRIEKGFMRISSMHNTLNETLVLTDHGRNMRVILRDFPQLMSQCICREQQDEKTFVLRLCSLLNDIVVSSPQSFHFGTWRASLRSASHWTRLESLAYNSFSTKQKAYLLEKLKKNE